MNKHITEYLKRTSMTQETQIENNKGYKVFTHKPLV
jgi:hypothetical protein